MSDNNCTCRGNCTTVALIISIVVGIIAAFLRITAAITVTPAFLWTVFGIAVVYLAIVLITAASVSCCECKSPCCVKSIITVLLGAIIATVLFAIVLLAVEFAATSILGAVITGLLLLSFFLALTETACLVRCIVTGRE